MWSVRHSLAASAIPYLRIAPDTLLSSSDSHSKRICFFGTLKLSLLTSAVVIPSRLHAHKLRGAVPMQMQALLLQSENVKTRVFKPGAIFTQIRSFPALHTVFVIMIHTSLSLQLAVLHARRDVHANNCHLHNDELATLCTTMQYSASHHLDLLFRSSDNVTQHWKAEDTCHTRSKWHICASLVVPIWAVCQSFQSRVYTAA